MSEQRPFEECPRYERCSVNSCPLDPEQEDHTVHKLDKEQKCPMEKRVRVRIGSQYPEVLSRGGMTVREYAAAQTFAKLSPAERLKAKERLSAFHFKSTRTKGAQ